MEASIKLSLGQLDVEEIIAAVSESIKLQGYTIETLPTGEIGRMVYVTNGTDSSVNPGTPVGGTGSTVRRVFFNGTIWTY